MTRHVPIAHEITDSSDDLALLRRFYADLYIHEFPDANERESVENMERYLRLKADNWYDSNNYHILLYLDGDAPIAGAIIDYLAEPNVGIIEFLVVSSTLRRAGLGRQALHWIERILNDDSRSAGHAGCDYLLAEMNDPFKLSCISDSMDPFERALVWHRWGFKKLRFPYVQPALSPGTQPVRNLLLMCKAGPTGDANTIPSTMLRDAVYGYARWAMRIDDPTGNAECRAMASFLAGRAVVDLLPLDTYVGASCRLVLTDCAPTDTATIDGALDVYAGEFTEGPISISRDLFKQFLSDARQRPSDHGPGHRYHLLSIARGSAGARPGGMASLFTLPSAGFIGYIVLDSTLRGQGYLAEILTAIERTMVRDDRGARGWYGECEPTGSAAMIFAKHGCHEVDIVYRQPSLPAQPRYAFEDAPVLRLMYKEFGESFGPPTITTEDFLCAVREIFRTVYQIEQPEQSEYYRAIQAQVDCREYITWR
jgi:GNAT superfamily N-acetyltransferase